MTYVATNMTPGYEAGQKVDVSGWPEKKIAAYLRTGRLEEKK
jgi:hypothetical protein